MRGGSRAPARSSGRGSPCGRSPTPGEAGFEPGTVDCIDLALVPGDAPFGTLSTACGEAAYRFIERAVALAVAGEVDALCTAPINKEALNAAGHRFPGHTEMLAAPHGHGRGVADADGAGAAGDPRHDAHRPRRRGRADRRRPGRAHDRARARPHPARRDCRAAHRGLRHQSARGRRRPLRARRGGDQDRARDRRVPRARLAGRGAAPRRHALLPRAQGRLRSRSSRCTTTRDTVR